MDKTQTTGFQANPVEYPTRKVGFMEAMAMSTAKSKEATRGIAVSAKELSGLCVTCNHAESCAVLKETREPVWYCEEFDDRTAPMEARDTAGARHVRSEAAPKPNGAAEGLCGNCAVRETCAYRSLETPIWFCEQYC
jgi:hypothetical protein